MIKKGIQTFLNIWLFLWACAIPSVPHTLSYYREESLRDDPKILARGFTIVVNVGVILIKEGTKQA